VARTLALPVTLAAIALAVTPAAAVADPPATTTYAIGKCVVSQDQPAQERPARFDYNCDGTGVMDTMTWTSWNSDGAKGTGTDASVECQPNCAQGAKLTNPIVVHAWNAMPASDPACPQNVNFYSDMTIAYPKTAPPWITPGSTWDVGTEFVTVDGMPAVHFSGLKPNCLAR
jgi:hypothetical protein